MDWEKIFANHGASKGQFTKHTNSSYNSTTTTKPNQNTVKRPKETFLQRRHIDEH